MVPLLPSFKPDVPSGEGKEKEKRNGGGNGDGSKDVSMIIAEQTGQKRGENQKEKGNFVSSIT